MNKNLCITLAASVIIASIAGITYCVNVVFKSDIMNDVF